MLIKPIKVVNILITAIIIFLLIPVGAILASWNSTPESNLYPVKRSLEKIALALLPNNFFETELRLKLIDRRSQEVLSTLIQTPSQNQALIEIIVEAQAAQQATVNLKSKQHTQATTKLITKLVQVNQSLEEIKTEPVSPKIDETQIVIKKIIVELENPPPQPEPQNNNKSKNKNKNIIEEQQAFNQEGEKITIDFNVFLSNFGKTGANIIGDLNKDNIVDVYDYNILVENF